MPLDPDYIWIDDVQAEYGPSRSWVEIQLRAGALSYVKIPGDRRTYLRRSELEQFLRGREMRRESTTGTAESDDDGQQSAG